MRSCGSRGCPSLAISPLTPRGPFERSVRPALNRRPPSCPHNSARRPRRAPPTARRPVGRAVHGVASASAAAARCRRRKRGGSERRRAARFPRATSTDLRAALRELVRPAALSAMAKRARGRDRARTRGMIAQRQSMELYRSLTAPKKASQVDVEDLNGPIAVYRRPSLRRAGPYVPERKEVAMSDATSVLAIRSVDGHRWSSTG